MKTVGLGLFLIENGELIKVEPKEVIYRPESQSQFIYAVEEGEVKIIFLEEGFREIVLDILGPGEIFGEMACWGEKKRRHLAVASAKTKICRINAEEFTEFMRRNMVYSLLFIEHLGSLLRKRETMLYERGSFNIKTRAARQLYRLCNTQRMTNYQDSRWTLRVTQRELAEMIGATRENVHLNLSQLVDDGIVRQGRGEITIIEMKKLKNKCLWPET